MNTTDIVVISRCRSVIDKEIGLVQQALKAPKPQIPANMSKIVKYFEAMTELNTKYVRILRRRNAKQRFALSALMLPLELENAAFTKMVAEFKAKCHQMENEP